MSFFGFDTSGRVHNPAAPGFSQAHDPFAGLSGRDGIAHDAIDFEDTYDGLGDQLDETDDAFNDDTFGGGNAAAPARVGKDFDFFGQTAKVADAIEEEHLRYNRQQPAARSSAQQQAQQGQQPQGSAMPAAAPYHGQQQAQRPARSGYEKYRDDEPMPDLHVDQSIWGIAPPKPAQPAAQPPPQPSTGRKIMSLEEVEAAMRAQARPKPSVLEPSSYPPAASTSPLGSCRSAPRTRPYKPAAGEKYLGPSTQRRRCCEKSGRRSWNSLGRRCSASPLTAWTS